MKSATCVYEMEYAHKKKGFWTKNDRRSPTKKAGKTPKKATCVYKGAYVHMKGKAIADVLSCITLLLLMS